MKYDLEGQICERCKDGVYKMYWPPLEQLRCDHCGRKIKKWSEEYKGRYLQITWHEGKGK